MKKKTSFPRSRLTKKRIIVILVNFLSDLPVDIVIMLLKINKKLFEFLGDLSTSFVSSLERFERSRRLFLKFLVITPIVFAIVVLFFMESIAFQSLIMLVCVIVSFVAYIFMWLTNENKKSSSKNYRDAE